MNTYIHTVSSSPRYLNLINDSQDEFAYSHLQIIDFCTIAQDFLMKYVHSYKVIQIGIIVQTIVPKIV